MEHQGNLTQPNKTAAASLVQSDPSQQPQEDLTLAQPCAVAESEPSTAIAPLTYDRSASLGESALFWYKFGFRPLPILPGGNEPAVEAERWFDGLSAEKIVSHWGQHSNHEIGFIPGENVLLLSPNGKKASKALFEIENAHDSLPNMALRSRTGMHYLLALGKGVNATATVNSGAADSIGVLTGPSLVLLPPSFEVELGLFQAANASGLTEASQSLVDAVSAYNASLVLLPNAGGTELTAPATAPATVGATFPVTGPIEAGKGGKGGEHAVPPASDTTFAAFTAFDGQSSLECDSAMHLTLPMSDAVRAPQAVLRPSGDQYAAGNTWDGDDDVLTPKAAENPVVAALMARDLYKTPLGTGGHRLTCPWAHEHADGADTSATYAEPDDLNSTGRFCCQYPHVKSYSTSEMLKFLGVPKSDARHKSVIRVVPGDLHSVLNAAERELAKRGRHFQLGGIIVSISTDPTTGDPSVVPTKTQALTRELSVAASWEKHDGRSDGWVPCDPPARHVGLLYDAQTYAYLSPLAGVARQPYFREGDGELVTQPGYDKSSKRFGVFDPQQFATAEPTPDAARAALAKLEDLLSEFRFAHATDKSAAISSIFTATVRPSLPHAPAFHVKAAVYGCGKSHLCEVISLFAGPAPSVKVSYSSTSEEATKSIMAVLVKNPAVVEFDDMVTDLIPHGIVNRMLTAEHITDRILGFSKTATVSTRTLFLSSGNNVGPVRDMLRRVGTINLDPRCATPATIVYSGTPVETVRKHRGAYVAAVLTIIRAWRHAGSPRTDVSSIATYGGAWADYCRHPLIWLGLADPATSLLAQVQHDPDSDALGALLTAWFTVFGSSPTTIRKVIASAESGNEDLRDAIRDFPALHRSDFDPSKFGWLLKKNANRIVGGLVFREAQADGRKAWCVMPANSPPLPLSPPLAGEGAKTVTQRLKPIGLNSDSSGL